MKLMYDKNALKAAAKYIQKNNPHYHLADRSNIKNLIYEYMHKYADTGDVSVSTSGFTLLFNKESEYILCDILVSPCFKCNYVEEDLP